MSRRIWGWLVFLGLVFGLSVWWRYELPTPSRPLCQGVVVGVQQGQGQQVYCLAEGTGDALAKEAKICEGALRDFGSVQPGELFVIAKSDAQGCEVRRERLPAKDALILGLPIDLNLASAAELETLPGVGPAMAAEIIKERERLGRFTSLGQLDQVKGVGSKRLETLQTYLFVVSTRSE